jgi:hypothetical protein
MYIFNQSAVQLISHIVSCAYSPISSFTFPILFLLQAVSFVSDSVSLVSVYS